MRQANSTTRSRGAEILHRCREKSSFRSDVGGRSGQGSVNGSHAPSRASHVSSPSPHGIGSCTPDVQHALDHAHDEGSSRGGGGRSIGSCDHNNGVNGSYKSSGTRSVGADILRLARRESIRAREVQSVQQESKRRASVGKNFRSSSSNQNRPISTTNDDPISPMTMSPTKPIHRKTFTEHVQVQVLLHHTKERISTGENDQSGQGVSGVPQVPSSLAGGGGVRDIQAALERERDKPQKPPGFQLVLDRIPSESESDAIHSPPATTDPSPHALISHDEALGLPRSIVNGITPNTAVVAASPRKKSKMRKLSCSKDNLSPLSGRHYHVLVVDDSGMVSSLPFPSQSTPLLPFTSSHIHTNK